jgi:hypothetical protein
MPTLCRIWILSDIKGGGLHRQSGRLTAIAATAAVAVACTVQLVAPYNSELEQKASAMQAEVSAWDLTMRAGAGTIADDPRNPVVAATLNKWRGEADAMLTLAVSSDPGIVSCNQAVKAVSGAIESSIPADLRAAAQSPATASTPSGGAAPGCETGLVADIGVGLDDLARVLKYCRADWVPDGYFSSLSQKQEVMPKPPVAPTPSAQNALTKSCLAEFKESSTPANSVGTQHGRAVSHLLTTLQVIVYVENRKKAAVVSK